MKNFRVGFLTLVFTVGFLVNYLNAQLPFEQPDQLTDEASVVLKKDSSYLTIYNTSKPFFYKGVENTIGVSCGDIPENRLTLTSNIPFKEKFDQVRWYSSFHKGWFYGMDPDQDWDGAKKWVDNDTLKWRMIYKLQPMDIDSITINCFYKSSPSDSILISQISLPVKEIPQPKLKIANQSFLSRKVSKDDLLKVEKLEVILDFSHPDNELYSNITYFEFVVKRGGKERVLKWHDNKLARDMREAIYNAKKNTKIIFRNIRSEKAKFDDVEFIIKKTSSKKEK